MFRVNLHVVVFLLKKKKCLIRSRQSASISESDPLNTYLKECFQGLVK